MATMQDEADNETVLIQQAISGSRTAFSQLVQLHHVPVRCYLVRYVRDGAAADDLAQEVFLRAYQGLAEYRGESNLRTWLLGMAKRLAAQHIRSECRRRRHEGNPLLATLMEWRMERLNHDPLEREDQDRVLEWLRLCVSRLAPESQRVITEHYFEGRPLEAIAARQGRKGGAVRMMLLRIRKALGECVRRKSQHDG
jgi:RNA polymerase sigma-70 factor, ECF subfamily